MNGLRAIAALTVLAFHIDRLAPWFGLPASHLILGSSADYAVVLFFVLSGFLIT